MPPPFVAALDGQTETHNLFWMMVDCVCPSHHQETQPPADSHRELAHSPSSFQFPQRQLPLEIHVLPSRVLWVMLLDFSMPHAHFDWGKSLGRLPFSV